jgi:uncharacterized repeat protein (TIGR03803 family)
VTAQGGADAQGTVFIITGEGKERVLHSFTGGIDGGYPGLNSGEALAMSADGEFYGTAYQGGDLSACNGSGCGVVFKITEHGTESVVHDFAYGLKGSTDGAYPKAGVVMDASGNVFGTTNAGGSRDYGTVFELTNSGETILHDFTGGPDGASPTGGALALDHKGNLYGAPTYGGDSNCPQQTGGCGVVFRLTP